MANGHTNVIPPSFIMYIVKEGLIMYQRTLLYLACMLAGFGLANVPTSTVINVWIANFFEIVGGITIIVFGLALLYLGIKSLLGK